MPCVSVLSSVCTHVRFFVHYTFIYCCIVPVVFGSEKILPSQRGDTRGLYPLRRHYCIHARTQGGLHNADGVLNQRWGWAIHPYLLYVLCSHQHDDLRDRCCHVCFFAINLQNMIYLMKVHNRTGPRKMKVLHIIPIKNGDESAASIIRSRRKANAKQPL